MDVIYTVTYESDVGSHADDRTEDVLSRVIETPSRADGDAPENVSPCDVSTTYSLQYGSNPCVNFGREAIHAFRVSFRRRSTATAVTPDREPICVGLPCL